MFTRFDLTIVFASSNRIMYRVNFSILQIIGMSTKRECRTRGSRVQSPYLNTEEAVSSPEASQLSVSQTPPPPDITENEHNVDTMQESIEDPEQMEESVAGEENLAENEENVGENEESVEENEENVEENEESVEENEESVAENQMAMDTKEPAEVEETEEQEVEETESAEKCELF